MVLAVGVGRVGRLCDCVCHGHYNHCQRLLQPHAICLQRRSVCLGCLVIARRFLVCQVMCQNNVKATFQWPFRLWYRLICATSHYEDEMSLCHELQDTYHCLIPQRTPGGPVRYDRRRVQLFQIARGFYSLCYSGEFRDQRGEDFLILLTCGQTVWDMLQFTEMIGFEVDPRLYT